MTVTVDYRIVDTTTPCSSWLIPAPRIYEKKDRTALGMGGKEVVSTSGVCACRDALNKAMVNMMKQLESQPWKGKIAKVAGNKLYINAGKKTGLKIGDSLMCTG